MTALTAKAPAAIQRPIRVYIFDLLSCRFSSSRFCSSLAASKSMAEWYGKKKQLFFLGVILTVTSRPPGGWLTPSSQTPSWHLREEKVLTACAESDCTSFLSDSS